MITAIHRHDTEGAAACRRVAFYYDEDGAPVARTLHPTTIIGDDDDEARVALAHAARALTADTLKDGEIGGTV
jgi:hypothetical protein